MKCFTHEVERCDNPDCARVAEPLCMRPSCLRHRERLIDARERAELDAQVAVERSLLWEAIAIIAELREACEPTWDNYDRMLQALTRREPIYERP